MELRIKNKIYHIDDFRTQEITVNGKVFRIVHSGIERHPNHDRMYYNLFVMLDKDYRDVINKVVVGAWDDKDKLSEIEKEIQMAIDSLERERCICCEKKKR